MNGSRGAQEAGAVLSRSVEALGAPEAVAAIHSVRGLAKCRGPRGEYTTLVESARGAQLRFDQRWPDGSRFLAFTRGDEAWAQDFDSGQREVLTRQIRAAIRSHEFQLLPLEIALRFQPVTAVQTDSGTVVRVADELGLSGELTFEATTGRLLRKTVTNYGRPEETVTVRIEGWREVASVLFPSLVVATDSSGDFVLDFESIEVNPFDEPNYAPE